MSEWISVKDQMPEQYEYVLVYAKMKGTNEPCPMSIANQYEGKWEMLNHSDQNNAWACGDLAWYMSEEEITHWHPLPKAPNAI
jgi:hypothetical protein